MIDGGRVIGRACELDLALWIISRKNVALRYGFVIHTFSFDRIFYKKGDGAIWNNNKSVVIASYCYEI